MKTTYSITVTAPDGEEILSLKSDQLGAASSQYANLVDWVSTEECSKGTKIAFNEVRTYEAFSYTK